MSKKKMGCKTSNEADRFFFDFYNEVSNSLRKRRSFSK